MHIEHCCRTAATFLSPELHDPGQIRPHQWRAWLNCQPPYDRHPTKRLVFMAYEFSDILGFAAVMHESIFAGYSADIVALQVIPQYRRQGLGSALLRRAAVWLQEDGIDRVTLDCFAHDPARAFYDRNGGVVIGSMSDDSDPAAVITYGFDNVKELAAQCTVMR
jgi:GNAT superfamily N-acetyltransferase